MLEFLLIAAAGNIWLRFRSERRETKSFNESVMNAVGAGLVTIFLGLFGIVTAAVLMQTKPVYTPDGFVFSVPLTAESREVYSSYFLMCRSIGTAVLIFTLGGVVFDFFKRRKLNEIIVNFFYRYLFVFGFAFGAGCLLLG